METYASAPSFADDGFPWLEQHQQQVEPLSIVNVVRAPPAPAQMDERQTVASDYSHEDAMLMQSIDDLLVDSDVFLGADGEISGYTQPPPYSPDACWDLPASPSSDATGTQSPHPEFADEAVAPKPKVTRKRKRSSATLALKLLAEDENDNTDADEDDEEYKPPSHSKTRAPKVRRVIPGTQAYSLATSSGSAKVTKAEKPKQRALTSKYRGVCWYKRTQRWVAQIKIRGRRKHVGYYKVEVEAKHAYDRAVAKLAANPNIDLDELTNL